MTPLTESRLRGLAEALGCVGEADPESGVWFSNSLHALTGSNSPSIFLDPSGSFALLRELRHRARVDETIAIKFIQSLTNTGISHTCIDILDNLTPARIAHAAADALGVKG